ncbi:MAG: RecQ family ATP-dependent DNA helicase [Kiritimatiellae bacterium]|nr:RecQ family ATP-dependent DNA helicase [Kiritimatiellia bacterium]
MNPKSGLQQYFNFSEFLQGQEETIQHILSGRDVVVIMPTGSGKSLCYQLSAMLLEGVTVIISPLIALMKDQVDGLIKKKLPATFINSALSFPEMTERMEGLQRGLYKLVYVSPERFRNRQFLDIFNRLHVSLMAIDEAHCISQWGHDFRPDYLRLKQIVEQLPQTRIMALTATATPDVRSDIIKQLGLGEETRKEPEVLVYGFARPNLRLEVSRIPTHTDKLERVLKALKKSQTGIIYCSTRKQTDRVYQQLKGLNQACVVYHGGLDDLERKRVQDAFMGGEIPVVVATNAFGMGIDRSDLRFVIHWDIPGSIEAYYQEIGRAGRDGKDGLCELLYNYADVRTQEFFIQGANPTRAEIEATWNTVRRQCLHQPVTRSISSWTEEISMIRNNMTTRTILGILDRTGCIQREKEPGEKVYTTSIGPETDIARLETEFPALTEKRHRDERKLKSLLKYVNTSRCRHAYILNYFGEHNEISGCSSCDRCCPSQGDPVREPTVDEWDIIQKILSCVVRMQGRFGCARIVQVLLGSRAKLVLERKLDQLSTHGILKGYKEGPLKKIIDALIKDGCIQISDGEYPLAEITARGKNVMWKKETPLIAWPETQGKTESTIIEKANEKISSTLYDPELYIQLKAWRANKAREENVSAFVIMHDRTLKAISVVCPETLAALETIKGIRPSKVIKYGDDILEVIDAWTH